MKLRMILCFVLLFYILLGLSACHAAEPPYANPASSHSFLLTPFSRLSGDIANVLIVDGIEQTIFKINDYNYGSTFAIGGQTYYIGESISPNMEINVAPLQYMGQPVYSWIEVRGAASGVNHYLSFRNEEPVYLAGIEGQVSYADLDSDGNNEIIAAITGALPSQVVIYFWDGSEYGKITSLNVAEALNAYSAVYKEGCFFVTEKEGADEEAYIYFNRKFIIHDQPYPGDQEGQIDIELSSADSYDLSGIILGVREALITENGFLAAYCMSDPYKQVILYDLNTKRLVASEEFGNEVEGYYCLRIDEIAEGVNFTFDDGHYISTIRNLFIDWQGNTAWQKTGTFRLPFAAGVVAEWEGDIVYIDEDSGKQRVLATFNEEIESISPEYARLKLFNVLDEHSFIYFAKYDGWSLATYIYDFRTGQSTKTSAYSGYPLGIGGNHLLSAFHDYGVEGMIVVDLSTLEMISEMKYNDGGHSLASISGNGELVMAVYGKGSDKKGFWFFDAQTGQLLKDYRLNYPVDGPYIYGFWKQRPYFFSNANGKTTLYILPEYNTNFNNEDFSLFALCR